MVPPARRGGRRSLWSAARDARSLIERAAPISVRQDNPKSGPRRCRSPSTWRRPRRKQYASMAATAKVYRSWRADLKHDINKGFVKVLAPAAAAPAVVVVPPPAPRRGPPAGRRRRRRRRRARTGAAGRRRPRRPPRRRPPTRGSGSPRGAKSSRATAGSTAQSVHRRRGFEVRWSDGDEMLVPRQGGDEMLDAAEGAAVAPVAAAVAAPVVE